MSKKIYFVFAIPVVFIFIIRLFVSSTSGTTQDDDKLTIPDHDYRVYALPIPEGLNLAGEEVPVHNFDIKERFDRELLVNSYWQSQTLLFIKRANRWFPLIEPILAEEGVPDDFKYLALIESGLTDAISPAGASGFWQIMQATGKELGLEVNTEVDERYHLEKSTRAAATFLRKAYELYGSWTLAAASYNMGRTGLIRQLSSQQADKYYDLWLNDETSRYVFRILAIKTILENPVMYGFNLNPEDLYNPYEYYTVKVDTTINDLVAFALHHQITYKELRTLNPWIRRSTLTNWSGKVYEIKIAKETLFGYEYAIPEPPLEPVSHEPDPQSDTDL